MMKFKSRDAAIGTNMKYVNIVILLSLLLLQGCYGYDVGYIIFEGKKDPCWKQAEDNSWYWKEGCEPQSSNWQKSKKRFNVDGPTQSYEEEPMAWD